MSSENLTCPSCDSDRVSVQITEEVFQYGLVESAVSLTARIPVYTCQACKFSFIDDCGMKLKDFEILKHLIKIGTPLETLQFVYSSGTRTPLSRTLILPGKTLDEPAKPWCQVYSECPTPRECSPSGLCRDKID